MHVQSWIDFKFLSFAAAPTRRGRHTCSCRQQRVDSIEQRALSLAVPLCSTATTNDDAHTSPFYPTTSAMPSGPNDVTCHVASSSHHATAYHPFDTTTATCTSAHLSGVLLLPHGSRNPHHDPLQRNHLPAPTFTHLQPLEPPLILHAAPQPTTRLVTNHLAAHAPAAAEGSAIRELKAKREDLERAQAKLQANRLALSPRKESRAAVQPICSFHTPQSSYSQTSGLGRRPSATTPLLQG